MTLQITIRLYKVKLSSTNNMNVHSILFLLTLAGVYAHQEDVPGICHYPENSNKKGEQLVTLLADCIVHILVAEISVVEVPKSPVLEDCNFFEILNLTNTDRGRRLVTCLVRDVSADEQDEWNIRQKIKENAADIFPFPSYDFEDCHEDLQGAEIKDFEYFLVSGNLQIRLCFLLDFVHKVSNAKEITGDESTIINFHKTDTLVE